MSLDDIKMSPKDFLEQADLDSGGFGKVCLCLHRSHGLVILKKVYTGPKRTEYNEALLEEGRMMHRLRHCRVVKLLGVIMEEGSYSLVMEYMEQGDLMRVLKAQVSIPLSVKGRVIMETIEGMRYLHGEGVIHKDLKPENILVDSDFHIKVQAPNSAPVALQSLSSVCLWDPWKFTSMGFWTPFGKTEGAVPCAIQPAEKKVPVFPASESTENTQSKTS